MRCINRHVIKWGEACSEYASGQKIYVDDKNVLRGLSALAAGYIHVYIHVHAYDHNIQRSSSLKPLGQSNPNFMWSIVRKGEC